MREEMKTKKVLKLLRQKAKYVDPGAKPETDAKKPKKEAKKAAKEE